MSSKLLSIVTLVLLFYSANYSEINELIKREEKCVAHYEGIQTVRPPRYSSFIHDWLFRRPEYSHYSHSLVLFLPEKIFGDPCTLMQYLSDKIKELTSAKARVMVIDFPLTPCDNEAVRKSFLSAIKSSNISTVIGIASDDLFREEVGRGEACSVLSSSTWTFDAENVKFGLTKLHPNTQQIPLGFSTLERKENSTIVAFLPSLSVAAASFFSFNYRLRAAVTPLFSNRAPEVPEGEQPFVARTVQPPQVETADLKYDGNEQLARLIEGRIVIIGKNTRDALHNDARLGIVTEAVLQASYIDALLDGSYIAPIGTVAFVALIIAWLAWLQLSFWRCGPKKKGVNDGTEGQKIKRSSSPERTAINLLILALPILVLPIALGYYLTTWKTGSCVICVLVKYAETRGHMLMHEL